MLKLTIQADKLYEPVVLGGVQWETAQKGEPGKLTFTVVKDDVISFNEGAPVRLAVDGKDIFQGYVFTKTRNKDHHIRVVAYDQLRYFKNKDVYVYKNKTASELVSMIADDYGLMLGTVEDTKYKIEKRVEDGQSLFDIIENALKITKDNTDKVFVLFDDAGRIALRDIQSMKLNMVIDKDAA
ncbi:MAG: hydrolase, partial [Selenomonadales bacterium]|nr:hydrolase [Selenomonadales bacterium]